MQKQYRVRLRTQGGNWTLSCETFDEGDARRSREHLARQYGEDSVKLESRMVSDWKEVRV